jgi:protein involved in polysaccharide export with SLBB domain
VTESRVQLMARARTADSLGRREEAFQLRTRLTEGDFEVGDVIIATYEGPQLGLNRRDSLVVSAGRVLSMQSPLGDLDLRGVLRSEVSDVITQRVAKYFKDEVVRVTPLLRLSVSGGVARPGFYQVRPDDPLSTVITRAGQAQSADLRRVVVKRGDETVWSEADVQTAFSDGLTVEQLSLEPGDEISIGLDPSLNGRQPWTYVLQIGATVVSAFIVQYLIRRHY